MKNNLAQNSHLHKYAPTDAFNITPNSIRSNFAIKWTYLNCKFNVKINASANLFNSWYVNWSNIKLSNTYSQVFESQ